MTKKITTEIRSAYYTKPVHRIRNHSIENKRSRSANPTNFQDPIFQKPFLTENFSLSLVDYRRLNGKRERKTFEESNVRSLPV